MKPFAYFKASDEAAGVEAGTHPAARFIAGGTGLVDLMRLGVEAPAEVVDVNALPWGQIESTAEGLRIGALVRNTELAYHPAVTSGYPVLSQAILSGASPQVRNMATVGGNLVQRTRCSYFRDVGVAQCNKRSPGSGCAAREGFSRMHAILGGSDQCIAVHPSDMCVALAALDAVVFTRGSRGPRTIPLGDFHTLPAAHPEVENVLERGELVTHVFLPASALARRSTYVKSRDRASFAFALASAAVALELDGKVIRQARVALGGVGTRPWRSREAEQALVGQPMSRPLFERAGTAAVAGARPVRDNAFKVKLAARVIVRALERAGEMA
ncbi:MAG TPA: xanthine dehydrogenase family protein subunit M [Polyangia bacterium]|nr:xanthine dehydrogenase family protein subunit M [Polyangia bacterium]